MRTIEAIVTCIFALGMIVYSLYVSKKFFIEGIKLFKEHKAYKGTDYGKECSKQAFSAFSIVLLFSVMFIGGAVIGVVGAFSLI